MNKFKKISAAALAAVLMAGTAVMANAEQSQAKLLTASELDIKINLGGGYFATGDGFVKIGEEEIAKWRETGKLEPTKIECDFDITGLVYWSGSFEGDGSFVQYVKRASNGYITESYILRLDKETGKIRRPLNRGEGWRFTSPDGYSFTCDQEGNNLYVTVQDFNGNTVTANTTKITYSGSGDIGMGDYEWIGSNNDDIIGYVKCTTDISEDSQRKYELNAVKKDGKLESIYKIDNWIDNFTIYFTTSNGILFNELSDNFYDGDNFSSRWKYTIYSTDTKKMYEVGRGELSNSEWTMNIGGFSTIHGTKTVITDNAKYVLVNLNENAKADIISNRYKYMDTNDGEIYFVQTEDDKWGYIDANGKELAIFDDAGDFEGDFAPVVKDGKAYLIDRNMNKVSEEVDANGVQTWGENLFVVKTEDDKYIPMTYASKPTTSEPTSEPTSTPTSEPTSTPTSEPTDNPATGATGIAATFGVIALAAGAVIIAKKRK